MTQDTVKPYVAPVVCVILPIDCDDCSNCYQGLVITIAAPAKLHVRPVAHNGGVSDDDGIFSSKAAAGV